MNLRELGEPALLDWIRKKVKGTKKGLLVGIGDDAAAFVPPPGEALLLTADTMAEGIHFNLKYFTPYQLGFKLASINVSDIYAMNGRPLYALFELTAPKETNFDFIKRVFDGVIDGLALYNAPLIGGNVSGSKSGLVLSMTVAGSAKKIIRRKGAKPGDGVFVTGPLGDSACGMRLLERIGKPIEIEKGKKTSRPLPWNTMGPLIKRHLMPVAKTPPQNATSMIDISDGLFIDLMRLCNESAVGVKIYQDQVPVSPELENACREMGWDPLRFATAGGEDYEILYTAPVRGARGGKLIGKVASSGHYLVSPDGKEKKLRAAGYRHFLDGEGTAELNERFSGA